MFSSATMQEEKNDAQWKIRALSQNVDDHPGYRFPEHPRLGYVSYSFPELEFKNRFPLFVDFYGQEIHEKNINLFALQEMGDNAKVLFKEFFEKEGFSCVTTKYCLDKGSVNYMIAFKKSDYTIKKTEQIYFTKSGNSLTDEQRQQMTKEEKFDHNLKVEFEKSAQVVTLVQNHNDKKEITIVNVHPGLTNEHRELAMEELGRKLGDVEPILMMGDFNQFDSTTVESKVYKKQGDILEQYAFKSTTQHVTEMGLKGTFVSHPFDILRFFSKEDLEKFEGLKASKDYAGIRELCFDVIENKKIDLVATKLDDVFVRGLDNFQINTMPFTWFNGSILDTSKEDRSSFQEKYLASHLGIFRHSHKQSSDSTMQPPPLVSDHIALVTEVTPKM